MSISNIFLNNSDDLIEACISLYREKWCQISFSTLPLAEPKVSEAVKTAYKVIGEQMPEVIYCHSPGEALKTLGELLIEGNVVDEILIQLQVQIFEDLKNQCDRTIIGEWWTQSINSPGVHLYNKLRKELFEHSWFLPLRLIRFTLEDKVLFQYYNQLKNHIKSDSYYIFSKFIKTEIWLAIGSYLDFCFSVLSCPYNQEKWLAYQLLVKNCGWLLPLRKCCLVVSHPYISFNDEHRIHAEQKPAIQFPDGYSIYFYRNILIPKKYGRKPPEKWHTRWLLKRKNDELRRIIFEERYIY
ncbi:DUF6745 domain-containing protein [Scytonema sp. NUACC26]|uniref:DUF6745 domain-containing protein n=1 Tax=Scytonema sp. NUACC26 TaxID=3140176 RepID=UPI0034DBB6B5